MFHHIPSKQLAHSHLPFIRIYHYFCLVSSRPTHNV